MFPPAPSQAAPSIIGHDFKVELVAKTSPLWNESTLKHHKADGDYIMLVSVNHVKSATFIILTTDTRAVVSQCS